MVIIGPGSASFGCLAPAMGSTNCPDLTLYYRGNQSGGDVFLLMTAPEAPQPRHPSGAVAANVLRERLRLPTGPLGAFQELLGDRQFRIGADVRSVYANPERRCAFSAYAQAGTNKSGLE